MHSKSVTDSGKPVLTEYFIGTVHAKHMDPVLICLVYNSPDVYFKKKSASLIKDLHEYSEIYSCKIIMGDFNSYLLFSGSDARFLYDLAGELGLKVTSTLPLIRVRGSMQSL